MGTEVNNVAGQNASGTITSYKLKPSLGETFKGVLIKEIIHDVLSEKLQGFHGDRLNFNNTNA